MSWLAALLGDLPVQDAGWSASAARTAMPHAHILFRMFALGDYTSEYLFGRFAAQCLLVRPSIVRPGLQDGCKGDQQPCEAIRKNDCQSVQ